MKQQDRPVSGIRQCAAQQKFTATTNDGPTTFSWSATGGSITQAGVFTAPAQAGDVTVTAALPGRPNFKASATVHVVTSGYAVFDRRVSLLSLSYVSCENDPTAMSGGGIHVADLDPLAEQIFNFDVFRSCAGGRAEVDGTGRMSASYSNGSSPLRLAFGLGVQASAETIGPNAGGAGGIWLVVQGKMDIGFDLSVTSTASCSADFHPGPLEVAPGRYLSIGTSFDPPLLDLDLTGQVQGQATLPPGTYVFEAYARADGNESTAASTNDSYFRFSCEIKPAP